MSKLKEDQIFISDLMRITANNNLPTCEIGTKRTGPINSIFTLDFWFRENMKIFQKKRNDNNK